MYKFSKDKIDQVVHQIKDHAKLNIYFYISCSFKLLAKKQLLLVFLDFFNVVLICKR